MTYRVILSRQARNYFALLPRDLALRIQEILLALESDAFPAGSKPLKGEMEGFFRIRVGHIRVIYQVRKDLGQIRVVEIGRRGDIY
jgi:mRNA interferase RelE/StbE